MKSPSLFTLWLTVFIDLVGFGIIVPLVPILAARFNTTSVVIGAVLASFSALQFIFAPILGRLSDRVGRRPVLMLSTAGATISYVIFAIGSGLPDSTSALLTIGLARAFAGAFGGNITVAQAYIADITPPEQRSKRMGLIGMAFGLGFICGPAIGGVGITQLGTTGPGWIAAALCALNFCLTWRRLPESRPPNSAQKTERPHLAQWKHTLQQPQIRSLVVVFFLTTLCFSCFEVTLAWLLCANFGLNIHENSTAAIGSYLFIYCGVISAFIQGGLIGRVVKRLGEPGVIALSLALTATSLAILPFVKGSGILSWSLLLKADGQAWWLLLGVLTLLSTGTSLTRPPLFGLLSNLAPADEQGATIGVAQSAGSLARIFGLFGAPIVFLDFSRSGLFVSAAAVLLVTCAVVWLRLSPAVPPPGGAD
jgi:MFS family permease